MVLLRFDCIFLVYCWLVGILRWVFGFVLCVVLVCAFVMLVRFVGDMVVVVV